MMNESTFTHHSTNQDSFETRCSKVLQVARDLFQRNPDWVTFFREVLGVSGAARNVFPTNQDYLAFEQSGEFGQIQQMVASLRNRKIPGGGHNEPTRVITVRLPESLHEALKVEATDHKTSMNKLCISKLLQVLADNEAAAAAPHANRSAPAVNQNRPPVPAARSTPPVPQPSNPVPQPSRPSFNTPVPAPTRNPVPSPTPHGHSQNQSTPATPKPDNQTDHFGNRF